MKNLLQKIQATQAGFGVALLRMVIGLIFFKAGAGKLFGLFGGFGIEKVTAFFGELGIPYPALNAYLVGTTELVAGILLFFGFLTRLVSIPVIIIMLVAILTAHKDGDFYYPLMILLSAVALIDVGAGRLSLDHCGMNCGKNKNL